MEYSHFADGQETSFPTVSHLTSGNTINFSEEKSNISTWGRSLYREEEKRSLRQLASL